MSKVMIIQVSSGRYMLFTIHSQAITLAIFIVLFLSLQDAIGQKVGDPVHPIISVEPNPVLPFYDRLDKVSRSRELIATSEFTSSFDWLVGVWTVNATGYAKNGFKQKKIFSWQEPPSVKFSLIAIIPFI
ncbi:hypothetical protein [Spirosoma sp. KNUC1025]|uniref:hypothetical protein n=1 Tax=Spirosoma sp. KNUC1025 TaxID=2894082 RepID=UPI003866F488|nr:hypothetical protein LN737_23295 [Spirosoma sp. KNUC1025]